MEGHAEYRAGRECVYRNALTRHGSGARHFHAPLEILAIGAARWLSVCSQWNKMDLRMVGLRHEPRENSGERHCLTHVVHRKGVVGKGRCTNTHDDGGEYGNSRGPIRSCRSARVAVLAA